VAVYSVLEQRIQGLQCRHLARISHQAAPN
jgi:hypothetical protein